MAGLVPPSLLFPRIVTEPSFNCTPHILQTSNDSSCNGSLSSTIQTEISSILYLEAALTGLVFLGMAIYFPSGPPSPPSFSATAERHDIKEGLKHILTTPRCITTGLAFACITVPMMWITVINQNLNPLGLTQEDTGYIGAAIIISSFIMNLVNSSLSDFFFGYLKTVICVFLAISFSFATWLALLCLRMVPLSKSYVYVSSITCMVALRSIIALFYELLMEVHYPAPESLTCLLWGQLGRIISAIFLGMFNLPESVLRGFTWMNYFLVTFTVLPLLLLLASKVQYKRSLHDSKTTFSSVTQPSRHPGPTHPSSAHSARPVAVAERGNTSSAQQSVSQPAFTPQMGAQSSYLSVPPPNQYHINTSIPPGGFSDHYRPLERINVSNHYGASINLGQFDIGDDLDFGLFD